MSLFAPVSTTPPAAELLALLTLRLTPGLGPRRIEALRQHFGSALGVLDAPREALRAVPGLDSRSVAALGTAGPREAAEQELEKVAAARAQGKDITLLGRGLPGYPPALEALGDPPAVLWVRGPLPELPPTPPAVGIVGTRSASPHALSLTRQIAADLAGAGLAVVSGLARGVDTAAHSAAVDTGGLSLGVVGHAVDRVYPAENVDLARRLTLVSEYPLGTGPKAHHFPQRNRLIAALSAGVLVVEGELKSGSLITATHALECGRTVFAVPGRAGDLRAAGPHRLLREGAVLTETAADILTELGWAAGVAASGHAAPELPPEQAAVYAALSEPRTLDDLSALTGLSLTDLQTALMMLQLSGLAEDSGGRWLRR
ncbi:DNA-binding protein [Deinococcus piscis]|uniref:DNA-binding protein n=1 Tax=Deinococcus piscis TaxID=394230 RepID=A0ABQ3K199_9DEIO|nr:DNA-processing protein DprA [Deinococcus piscis]GHF95596.1 DNA-binding protein [Deinococcus piscis]